MLVHVHTLIQQFLLISPFHSKSNSPDLSRFLYFCTFFVHLALGYVYQRVRPIPWVYLGRN